MGHCMSYQAPEMASNLPSKLRLAPSETHLDMDPDLPSDPTALELSDNAGPPAVIQLPADAITPLHLTLCERFRTIYVAGGESHCIYALKVANGELVRRYGSRGREDGQLLIPCGVVLVNGLLYIAESRGKRVSVFQEDGTFVRKWKLDFQPSAISCVEDRLLLSDSGDQSGVPCVHVYNTEGFKQPQTFRHAVGLNQVWSPAGIAYDPESDKLFIASTEGNVISVFKFADGEFLTNYELPNDASGARGPTGLVYHNGHLFVTALRGESVLVIKDGSLVEETRLSSQSQPYGITASATHLFVVDRFTRQVLTHQISV